MSNAPQTFQLEKEFVLSTEYLWSRQKRITECSKASIIKFR